MPGAPSMWIDPWAPAQYSAGGTGAPGPLQSADTTPVNQQTQSTTNIPVCLASTIILALVGVFVLQQLGFRFVVAAGVGR